MNLFIISLVLGLFSTALTIFSIFFNYDEEKPVKLSKWGWMAVLLTIILAISGGGIKYFEHQDSLKGKAIADSLQNELIKKNDRLAQIISEFENKTIKSLDTNLITLRNVSSNLVKSSEKTEQIASNLNSSINIQNHLLNEQKAVRNQVLKAYYPLEPITISYEIHFSMDTPELQGYTSRVQSTIVAQLRKDREGRGVTRDDLSNEGIWFILSNKDEWKPDLSQESKAYEILLTDMTTFSFQIPDYPNREIRFTSVRDEDLKDIFVHLRSKGEAEQKFELIADFTERIFIKKVFSINPMRTGKDETSISSIDLIGRKMTWELETSGRLQEFGLSFSYNYQSEQSRLKEKTEINQDEDSKIITARMVGLEEILTRE